MSGISTEQWERRKWYLVRSLFEENPILSPIPETQEVSLEPTSPLATYISRPYSPLPDLIIEKEPNRHDEPEEYYHALEIKIKKLYRKLFIDTEKFPIFTGLVNEYKYSMLDNEYCADTAIFVEEPVLFEESGSNESSDSIDLSIVQSSEKRQSYIRRYTKSTDRSEEVQSTTSSESQNNEIIVTQVLVHQTDSEKTYKDVSKVLVDKTQTKSSEIKNDSVDVSPRSARGDPTHELSEHKKDSSISNEDYEGKSRSDVEDQIPACLSDASSLLEVPDLMRRRQTSNDSAQSISALDVERHFSAEFSIDKRLEVRDIEEAEFTSPELSVILESSTMNKQFRPQDGDRKRRFVSGISTCQSSSFAKQRKRDLKECVTVAIQTSFSESDDECKWQEIQKHFFEGNPRIFKLCSCTNHVCC